MKLVENDYSNRKKGLKDEITKTQLYLSGEPFSSADMTVELGRGNSQGVRNAISSLLSHRKLCETKDGMFYRPTVHWINRTTLLTTPRKRDRLIRELTP
jgi:hypothetical protein